jgi:raffinose/stachyose/melibiose transport system substrate-binding protein
MVTFDGKIYGVPVENVSVAVVFYNKALFAKHKLTPPATYDELLTIVHALKDKGIAPFALGNKTKWPGSMFFMYLVDRLDGPATFAKAAEREGATFEAPAFIDAGRRIQELVKAGAFQTGFNGLDYDSGGTRALLYSGKAAMQLMGSWEIGNIKSESEKADSEESRMFYQKNLGFFPFPAVTGGAGDPKNVLGTVGNNFYSVAPTCKHPDEAFKLIQYMIDDISVEVRGKAGRIPPVKGFKTDDPVLQEVITIVERAPNVQFWYDQYLPPSVAEAHKDTSQALFALSMTPEEAAKQFEQAAKDYFKK